MGTNGYAAPEYIMTGHLTIMSDVYSFGVVLLELLTGRRSVDKTRPKREQNLVDWTRPLLKDPKKIERLMDPRLDGQYSIEGSKLAAILAYQCLSKHAKSRPKMSAVIQVLEPISDLKDMPLAPFVYVVPSNQSNGSSHKGRSLSDGHGNNKDDDKGGSNVDDGEKQNEGRQIEKQRRSFRTQGVHSYSALYKAPQSLC